MRKTVYILIICVLSTLVYCELNSNINNRTSSEVYVPTARFLSAVKKENQTDLPKKTAYLTFDDGPSKNTVEILEILKKKKAVATFFLIGNEINEENKSIIKQEIAQGCVVGVHTYCHKKDVMYCNAESFLQDFSKASQAIQDITGEKPVLHRFPWGSNNAYVSPYVQSVHENLKNQGIRSFDWNVSGEDAIGTTVPQSTIFRNIKKDLSKYDKPIILLHDAASTTNTVKVLEKVIDYIKSEGYGFDVLTNREEYMFPASWRK